MEFVVFSDYIALRDIVFNLRKVNKECNDICSKKFKSVKKRSISGRILIRNSNYWVSECTVCKKYPKKCRFDPFNSIEGLYCYSCQPEMMCLTVAKTYLDRCVIKSLDRIHQNGCTYFLEIDVKAYDFVFKGPMDRKLERLSRKNERASKRKQQVFDVFKKLNITDTIEHQELLSCKYIKSFLENGNIGIRLISKLLDECYEESKKVYNELKNSHPEWPLKLSLGYCLGWSMEKLNSKYNININRIDTAKQNFLDFAQKYERGNREKRRRQEDLISIFNKFDISTKHIDSHPYIIYGEPSIEETCKIAYEIKWLHENTPFCLFVEQNKTRSIYNRDFIRPDPYYNMIFNECVEAKAMVISLGYVCPQIQFT